MSLKLFFVVSTLLVSSFCQSQNENNTDYLVSYGQVWGFLKYFHPEPSNCDWDQVLLDGFLSVSACFSAEEFNVQVSKLIDRCGSYKAVRRDVPDSLIFSESFEWLSDSIFNDYNRKYLTKLVKNKPNFNNKYISSGLFGNPKIINEREFNDYMLNPAINYLCLTRYWNIINYYFPYRQLIPLDWNQGYKSLLPEFLECGSYEDYLNSVTHLIATIKDAHAFLFLDYQPRNYKFPPLEFISVNDGYYVGKLKPELESDCKIQYGDKIISVDGQLMEDRLIELSPVISASNDYYISKSTFYLTVTYSDSVRIEVERNGKKISETLKTDDKFIYTKPSNTMPYEIKTDSISGINYCYIDMGLLKRSDINSRFKKTIKRVDNIVIDSRNYPNITLIKLCKVLIPGRTKFSLFRKMNFDYPSSYKWVEGQTIGSNSKGYEGNLYILVDYQTMSQAEYTVMALQKHPNSFVIGGQTAGADGDISGVPLPFGIKTYFSGLGVYYPDGSETQQIGIRRDIHVIQDRRTVLERRDLILEKALKLMRVNVK